MLMKLKRLFAGNHVGGYSAVLVRLRVHDRGRPTTQGEGGASQQCGGHFVDGRSGSRKDCNRRGRSVPSDGFRDDSGEIVGFDIDLANAVCEKLGVQAEIKPIDWSAKEAELAAGSIDLIWNGYTVTDERREKVLFTDPYLANSQIHCDQRGLRS